MPTVEEIIMSDGSIPVRLEIVKGVGIWEAMPGVRHQRAAGRIGSSFRRVEGSDCACEHLSDVAVRFPDGSIKRPDISVFCVPPADTDEAVEQVPEAAIEIVSRGYEAKDLIQGVPFYLSHGVKDVIVFSPHSNEVTHFRSDGERTMTSPAEIRLECGCMITV